MGQAVLVMLGALWTAIHTSSLQQPLCPSPDPPSTAAPHPGPAKTLSLACLPRQPAMSSSRAPQRLISSSSSRATRPHSHWEAYTMWGPLLSCQTVPPHGRQLQPHLGSQLGLLLRAPLLPSGSLQLQQQVTAWDVLPADSGLARMQS